MSRINDLIRKLCPNGVEYKKVWQITTWDKKYNSVDKYMQPKIRKYNYLLANQLNEIIVDNGDVFILETGINNTKKYTNEDLAGDNLCNGEIIAIPWGGTPNVKYYNGKFVTGDNRIAVSNDINVLNTKFLYYIFENKMNEIADFYRGSGIKHPEMKKVLNLDIPVPPIKVQEEIVKILDKFGKLEAELEAELEARKSQYEFWRGKLLNRNNEIKKLSEVSDVIDSLHATPQYVENGYPMIRVADVKGGIVNTTGALKVDVETYNKFISKYKPQKGDIIISRVGSFGNLCIVGDEDMCLGQNTSIIHPKINDKYLYHYLSSDIVQDWIKNNVNGSGYKSLSLTSINEIPIVVPSIQEQQKVANILNQFDKLVNSISEGLPAEIEFRRQQYEYYRNKLLSFEEL